MKSFPLFFALLVGSLYTHGQSTVVTGKVTDAATGDPVPFANVIFKGTQDGAITDFEGNFSAKTSRDVDSIEVRYIGYVRRAKPLRPGESQVIDFQLDEDVQTLGEVVIYAGENPAFPIMRNVVRSKEQNDKRSLSAYEYESYTKIEFDVDNMSDQFRNRKIMTRITHVLDSIDQLAGEDGKPILPVFISEAISRFYYKKDPTFRHENIIKTKVSGVGITDGTLSSQVIGSSFQEYNFYQNWLNVVTKEFVSPLADSWKLYYEVYLEDSLFIGNDFCYRIDFYPKREQDLAFTGTMWITKNGYALRRIDAQVPKSANLNYIEKVKIQQDLIKTSAGPWLPEKTRVLINVAQINKDMAGMLAKFYISTKDHVVNQPRENKFYLNPVTLEETATIYDEDYWQRHRHDSLSPTEINVYRMIDTLRQIPVVKTYMDLAKFAVNGYYKVGKIDLGPYTTFAGKNDIEGVRVGFGARTTIDISRKWTFGGHIGYGFGDRWLKYKAYGERILDRQPWTTIRYEQQKEVEQIWLLNDQIEPNSLFYSLSRFGTLNQPFLTYKYRLSFFRQISTGFSGQLAYKYEQFDPLFDFRYYKSPGSVQTSSSYQVNELSLTSRYAKDELFVVNDNERISLGTTRWPAFNLFYTYGFQLLGSDFTYHKIRVSVEKRQKMGLFGVSAIKLGSGYVLGDLPYPLLHNTLGNETPVYVGFAYNLMNYFEFSTDRFVELRYRHSFEGFILNTIPLMKRLKWRLIGSANAMMGGISDRNVAMTVNKTGPDGQEVLPFRRMRSGLPYVEVGYGVENIFKIFAIEAFHRLTYLDHPDVSRFALKFNIQIIL